METISKRQLAEKVTEKFLESRTCSLSNARKSVVEHAINQFMNMPDESLIKEYNRYLLTEQ